MEVVRCIAKLLVVNMHNVFAHQLQHLRSQSVQHLPPRSLSQPRCEASQARLSLWTQQHLDSHTVKSNTSLSSVRGRNSPSSP